MLRISRDTTNTMTAMRTMLIALAKSQDIMESHPFLRGQRGGGLRVKVLAALR
jgi:hypothetical protein